VEVMGKRYEASEEHLLLLCPALKVMGKRYEASEEHLLLL